jgi:hypothetical protein
MASSQHAYEVRPSKDHRGVDLTRSFFMLLTLATLAFGCNRDQTQRDVTNRLFAPFSMPKRADQQSQFLAAYRERIGVSPDSAIIGYTFHPFFLRKEDKDFSDAIAALTHSVVNEPKRGKLSVTEHWYYSTYQAKPLLLRRTVISWDRGFEDEIWASETVLQRISAHKTVQ